MKKKIFSIVRTILAGAVLVTAVSCNNIDDSAESTPDKKAPVLRVSIADDTRTVLPDYDFSGFKFELNVAQEGGGQTLGTYGSKAELEKAVIKLEGNGLDTGIKYQFVLTAKKDNLSCTAKCSQTLTEGENVLKMKLYADELGDAEKTGTLAYTLDYSKAANADLVSHIEVYLGPNQFIWDNEDVDKDPVPEDKKISINKELNPGNHEIEICLYADGAQLLYWDESVIIAEGLTSTKVTEIKALDEVACTVTFNFNYEGSKNVTVKTTRKSKSSFFGITPKIPSRLGYALTGWYKESECINKIDKDTNITESFTAYAKWEDVDISEVTVYDTNSMYIARGNYTVTTFTEETQGAWYKLATEANSSYKIYWCDSENQNNYSEVPANLADAILYVYDSNVQPLEFDQSIYGNYDDGKDYLDDIVDGTFKARGNITYIYVRPYSNEYDNIGPCAFRVMNAKASSSNTLSAVVTSEQKDIELDIEEKNDGSIIFKIPSEWISDSLNCKWFFDGQAIVVNKYTYSFNPLQYKRGTHLLSLEIEKDGKYYSYSAQIKVQ